MNFKFLRFCPAVPTIQKSSTYQNTDSGRQRILKAFYFLDPKRRAVFALRFH